MQDGVFLLHVSRLTSNGSNSRGISGTSTSSSSSRTSLILGVCVISHIAY